MFQPDTTPVAVRGQATSQAGVVTAVSVRSPADLSSPAGTSLLCTPETPNSRAQVLFLPQGIQLHGGTIYTGISKMLGTS